MNLCCSTTSPRRKGEDWKIRVDFRAKISPSGLSSFVEVGTTYGRTEGTEAAGHRITL